MDADGTTSQLTTDRPSTPSTRSGTGRRSRRSRHASAVVAGLAAAAAVGGGLAGCHPTGTAGVDELYGAAAAAVITVAAAPARRWSVLLLAAAGFALSRSWLLIPAGAALALAFAATFQKRAHRRWNALVGALAAQVILRWPSIGFHGLTAAVATVATVLVVVSGWRNAARRTRRVTLYGAAGLFGAALLLSAPAVISALFARHPAEAGIDLARLSLTDVETGHAPHATTRLRSAAADLTTAHGRITGWWNAGAYLVPGVAQQQRAMVRGSTAGADLTATAA
ncbi:MAG TPA: hypothetical protein VFH70_09145, partial [Acidimicrobiales bacterium]|nr:hypothetical protein [Acidimicrobiales bacterium]